MCPNVKWGGNVPCKRVEEEPYDKSLDLDPQLPAAYIQATRGYTPTAKRSSKIRTTSLPTTPRAGRRTSLTSSSTAGKSPWKAGPSRWEGPNTASGMSGVFSAPRSERSGLYGRPKEKRSKSPTTSSNASRIYTTSPGRPVFTTATGSKLVPGIGAFLTSAAPVKKEKTRTKSPKSERSTYSKCPRRRSPSPRPGTKEKSPAPDTDKLLEALHERTALDRELKEVYGDMTQEGHFSEQADGNSVVGTLMNGNGPLSHTELSAVLSNAGTSMYNENMLEEFQGWQPLHWAAKEGSVEFLEQLLVKGADVHARLPDGRTPLDVACESLERSSILGEDINEKKEVVRILEEVSLKKNLNEDTKEMLGAGIFSKMLDVLPRQGWDCVVAMLPDEELAKVAVSCKGLEALTRPRLLEIQAKRNLKRTVAPTDNLGVAMNMLNELDWEGLVTLAKGVKPTSGVMRVLQMLCIISGEQWLELDEVWPVAKYLLRSDTPLSKLLEKAAEPERVSWEEANWLLSILDEHANTMAVACDDLLGSILTLIICLLLRLISLNGQLPTLRLPEGFLMPTERPEDEQYTITSLKTI
eukprot:TRINITY_DN20985_c0_g1_i1.p1 TRINITY_DN20985_c0_g1~~TRINITY_DN20985_c0_g1_i1.p1  ORF type:complete len:629 (+),score=219.96 TRINITY_DN20985_c0_g1_i1:144-1889(+)